MLSAFNFQVYVKLHQSMPSILKELVSKQALHFSAASVFPEDNS